MTARTQDPCAMESASAPHLCPSLLSLSPSVGPTVEVGLYRIASGVRRAQEMLLLVSLVPYLKPQILTSWPTVPMGLGEGEVGSRERKEDHGDR